MYSFVNNCYAYHFNGISANKDGKKKKPGNEYGVLIETGGTSKGENDK